MVFKLDKTINKKFRSSWVGPYSITKVISPVVYEIKYKNKTEVVHFDRLKPYSDQPSMTEVNSFIKLSTYKYVFACLCMNNKKP